MCLCLFSAMSEARAQLESFTHRPGSNITLECLTSKADEYDDLTWERLREKGVELIGNASIADKDQFKIFGNNEHFKLHRTTVTFILNITNVQPSDAGIYVCMWRTSSSGSAIRNVAVLVVTGECDMKIPGNE